MKLIINKNQLDEPSEIFLRHAGYAFIYDRQSGKESYVRRLDRGFYPRFHIYIEYNNGQIIFNLHLDQKQPSYSGAHAHNAEYDGEAVEGEIERIKSFITQNLKIATQDAVKAEKKSWWHKLFS
jgi:hypothetical protein